MAKSKHIFKWPTRVAFFDDGFYGGIARTFDTTHAKTYFALFIHREESLRLVYVRSQNTGSPWFLHSSMKNVIFSIVPRQLVSTAAIYSDM